MTQYNLGIKMRKIHMERISESFIIIAQLTNQWILMLLEPKNH
jgi:hypothetical protein